MTQPDYNMDLDSLKHEVDVEVLDLYDEKKEVDKKPHAEHIHANHNKLESSPKLIEKTMMIEEVVNNYPDIIPMLMDYGVHCVGCGGASFETLEEGLMGHGASSDDVDGVVFELNEYIKTHSK